jgi:3-hydroxyacyl-CoA dehydrogenase
MGSGIAQVIATSGYATTCYDTSSEALERARETVVRGRFGLDRGVERGKITKDQADAALGRLTFTGDLSEALVADVIVEAVYEDLQLKLELFRELDAHAAEHAVLASNTSGFPITALAGATLRPQRVIGWHWASPVPVQRLAEIVVAPSTSPATIETVRSLARACGKNPIVVKDDPHSWGFVTNRLLMAAMREAERIVELGIAPAADVDQLLVDCFSWPTGILGMRSRTAAGWSE